MIWASGGWAPLAMIEAYSVCARVRPSRSERTGTKAPIPLKIGEREERISTVAISWVIAWTRRCRTEARIGSTEAGVGGLAEAVLIRSTHFPEVAGQVRKGCGAAVLDDEGVGHVADPLPALVDDEGVEG